MNTIPEKIVYIGQLMFERRLTDIAGGNISVREENTMYITPRYAGHLWHWSLETSNIISGPIDSNELIQHPSFSREGLSHIHVYRSMPEVGAIIHAHPYNVQPFVALEMPMEPVLYYVDKYERIEYIEHVPNYSWEQAESIVTKLREKKKLIGEAAAAVLLPRHGIFVAGKDLWSAIDCLERINTNAWCILAGKMLSLSP